MNLFYQPLIDEDANYLDKDESRHCSKVLRKKEGDEITVIDGKGNFYKAILSKVDTEQCFFTITHTTKTPPRNFYIHIAVAPTKNIDRIEWFVEKSIELGIDEITFIQCDHSERIKIKMERMQRIAVSAIKQSLKASLPKLNDLMLFNDFIQREDSKEKFIAFVDTDNQDHLKNLATPAASYCVLIGPEGDFTNEELLLAMNNGYKKTSLGKSRLRTETAALAACHTLNLLNL